MKRSAFTALLFSFLAVCGNHARALTIDEFNDGGPSNGAEIANQNPSTASVNITSSSAVGGSRLLYISRSSAFNGGTTRIFTNTRLFHNQDSGVRAFSRVTWDKDADPLNSVIPNGLSSIDLEQDGGSEIILPTTFDYGNAQPIDLTLRIFDASDPSGNTFSQISITLNQVLNDFNLVIPFAKLSSFGGSTIPAPSGTFTTFTFFPGIPANIKNIGAIVLEINGQNGDSDISIASVRTNGKCEAVPDDQGKVIDDCGICAGQPNYKQSKDECGVCIGSQGYGTSKDDCGICFGNNSSKDSCGLCPSAPNYNNAKDPCGVCFGNGTSCADCSGTPNGTAKFDICNVCNGNGTTCLDCKSVPFGTSKLDACGTCGGTILNASDCDVTEKCITVQATSDILAFEKRLVEQTKQITKKFREEDKRNKKNGCGINTKPSSIRVEKAYEKITSAGKDIFTKGVEICGDNCITVSFADQVLALAPTLKLIEKETTSLAKKVQSCYKKKKIKTTQGIAGVATTIKSVNKELTQLVKDCKDKQICPK